MISGLGLLNLFVLYHDSLEVHRAVDDSRSPSPQGAKENRGIYLGRHDSGDIFVHLLELQLLSYFL